MKKVCLFPLVYLLGAVNAYVDSNHTDNWAVLVDTSVFYFNYRHIANTLSFYHVVKELGIPDSNIILMLAEDIPCNSRNAHKAELFSSQRKEDNLYDETVQVDYRGDDVTVENFLRVLTGRHEEGTSPSKKLESTSKSNILVYLTGHGGDQFLKFRDREVLTSQNLADAFQQMNAQARYNELLFVIDTCQASTMFDTFSFKQTPNVFSVGSSLKGENSYSYQAEARELGVSLIDRFSFYALKYLEDAKQTIKKGEKTRKTSLKRFIESFTYAGLKSHHGWNSTLSRKLQDVDLGDFFALRRQEVELLKPKDFSHLFND
eukprot:maker-scaffold_53-snap-gene-0.35-mRNA-1 protein AED:0.03 eAED:0.03 QI:99/1/1/1/0/0/4/595/317